MPRYIWPINCGVITCGTPKLMKNNLPEAVVRSKMCPSLKILVMDGKDTVPHPGS